MTTIILDTLDYAEKLKSCGFTDQQAQGLTRVNAELIERQLATKQDVDAHESNIKRDIAESENRLEYKIELLRAETKQFEVTLRKDIEILRAETKQDIAGTYKAIAESKAELIRWVVAAGFLQTAFISALLLKVAHLI